MKIPIAALQALFLTPRLDLLTGKEDPSLRKNPYYLVLAASLITLGSCGKPVPLTAAEDQRIDQAMARVKAEQDRTDRVEKQKQTTAAELHQQRSVNATPIMEVPVHPIQQNNHWQNPPPADVQASLPSDKGVVDSSGTNK